MSEVQEIWYFCKSDDLLVIFWKLWLFLRICKVPEVVWGSKKSIFLQKLCFFWKIWLFREYIRFPRYSEVQKFRYFYKFDDCLLNFIKTVFLEYIRFLRNYEVQKTYKYGVYNFPRDHISWRMEENDRNNVSHLLGHPKSHIYEFNICLM